MFGLAPLAGAVVHLIPMKKHIKEMKSAAAKYGFKLHRQSTHLIWRNVFNGAQVVTAKSPSDHRELKNNLSRFRRYGALA